MITDKYDMQDIEAAWRLGNRYVDPARWRIYDVKESDDGAHLFLVHDTDMKTVAFLKKELILLARAKRVTSTALLFAAVEEASGQ